MMLITNNILHTAENLRFKCITEDYTIKVIDNLENKNSSGHDGIEYRTESNQSRDTKIEISDKVLIQSR